MDEDVSLASRLGWETLVQYQHVLGHKIAVACDQSSPTPKGTLLLLHGFPTSSWDWYKLWPSLAADYHLIATDMLGFGLSDKPYNNHYSIAQQADICEAILADQNVKSCAIIAHDYGDTVAQELLARLGDSSLSFNIERSVMLNGGIMPSAHRPRRIQKLLAGPLGPMLRKLLTKERFKRSICQVFGGETQPVDPELNIMWDYIAHEDGHLLSHKLLQYMAERAAKEARWVPTVLEPLRPLLLINGSADPVSGKHLIDAYKNQGGTGDILELEGIGHYPQLEAAQITANAILDFLSS